MGLFGPSKKEKELENEIKRLKDLLLPEHQDIAVLKQQIALMEERKSGLEKAISDAQKTIGLENEKINNLENKIHDKEKLIFGLENDIVAQDFGIYKPTYVFAISDQYKDKLNDIRQEQKQMIRESTACSGSMSWTVDGSAAKGKKMVANMQKLLLRAFNVECDNIVDNVKISNFEKSVERISTTSEQISRLGEMMRISISPKYEKLKIEEVKLALDFQQKKQEEKEKQKELREQQREEARVQKEIEEERKKLKKEKNHYQNALDSILEQIQKNGETQDLLEKKQEYEQHLNDTDRAISDVDYREANKRAGYVYIISNIGSFGENVYKIGMTRRLDPQERIDELGDASVPFEFNIHAMIFSDDAPKLESTLHNHFEDRKVNKINGRKEFFKVTLDEIKDIVRKNFDKTVEWIDFPEAEQYRQSLLIEKQSENKQ